MAPKTLLERLKRVRLLALDVDGVLTDGSLYMSESGEMQKKFTAQDGFGLKQLIDAGVRVALISGLAGQWIIDRFQKLGIDDFHMGLHDKSAALDALLEKYDLASEQVAFVGDDVIDLPVLARVGLAIGVPNAVPEVRAQVHLITTQPGGEGAVREVCDLLLRYNKRSPKTLGVIPVHMASRRFPGKAMTDLCGKPLFTWVYERSKSAGLDEVVVSTDSAEVIKACGARGIPVGKSTSEHRCGSDRVAKAAAQSEADIIVNLQCDEPLVEPQTIGAIVDELIHHPEYPIATACTPFSKHDDPADENTVKVVCSKAGMALYFSRAPVPYQNNPTFGRWLKHIGIYGFQRAALERFATLGPSPLEGAEGLEQLRALEHGLAIRVIELESKSIGINTPADLKRVAELLRKEGIA